MAQSRRALIWALVLGCLVALAGCAVAGATAYVLHGPPKVPARYVPAMEPMAVLVENYQNPSLAYLDSEQLARRIHDDLVAHQVAPMIDPDQVVRLRDGKGSAQFRKMTVVQIGRELGAKQVLYVNVLESNVERVPSDVMRGHVSLRVRMIDTQTGEPRWPKDASDGFPLSFQTPLVIQSDPAGVTATHDALISAAALNVSRLFYQWQQE